MLLNAKGIEKTIEKNWALRFTDDGVITSNLNFEVTPSLLFEGQVHCSFAYKINNPDPTIGIRYIALFETGVNEIHIGLDYQGTDTADFVADLNGSIFRATNLFDADIYQNWSLIDCYIDWATPAQSAFYYNDVLTSFDAIPSANSTQFIPQTSDNSLNNVVSNTSWSAISITKPTFTLTDYQNTYRHRIHNGTEPYSLGKRGNLIGYNPSWMYLPFSKRDADFTLRNVSNDSELQFTDINFVIDTNENIQIPITNIQRARQHSIDVWDNKNRDYYKGVCEEQANEEMFEYFDNIYRAMK